MIQLHQIRKSELINLEREKSETQGFKLKPSPANKSADQKRISTKPE